MRRRRQKNPLLMRIIVISVVVHIFALPVLAHFGAFKKIHDHYVEANMVVLPPPPVEKEKPVIQKKQQIAKAPAAKKGPASVHHGPSAPHAHVAIAQGPGAGDTGPSIDQGNLKPGELPPPPADNGPKKTDANATAPMPEKTVVDTKPPPPPAPVETKPEPKKEVVAPVAPPPPVVHDPVFTQAMPLEGHQPQPSIPDDLRSDALDKTFVAEVIVGPDGMPTSVMASQSTGSNELDRLAMDTAKQWRFKPATRDGQPVESRVRLHIEFQVN